MKKSCFLMALTLSATPLSISVVSAQPVASKQQAQTITVFISGEVLHPGRYTFKAGTKLTLFDLVASAGGITKRAGVDEVMVGRGAGGFVVNVSEVFRQGGKGDLLLLDGDKVVVPVEVKRISVIGAVNKPGIYKIPEGGTLSVAQALSLAGGVSEKGDIEVTRLTRQLPKTGQLELSRRTNDVKRDQLLQKGDALIVRRVSPVKRLNRSRPRVWLLSPNPTS